MSGSRSKHWGRHQAVHTECLGRVSRGHRRLWRDPSRSPGRSHRAFGGRRPADHVGAGLGECRDGKRRMPSGGRVTKSRPARNIAPKRRPSTARRFLLPRRPHADPRDRSCCYAPTNSGRADHCTQGLFAALCSGKPPLDRHPEICSASAHSPLECAGNDRQNRILHLQCAWRAMGKMESDEPT
jgi:hypothetical protein